MGIDAFSRRWLQASATVAAELTASYWAMLCVGRLVAAIVTPYVDHTKYLAAHLILAIASISVLTVATHEPVAVSEGSWGWWAGVVTPTALFGFALAPLFPGAMLVAEELLGKSLSGRAASIMVFSASAGEMV